MARLPENENDGMLPEAEVKTETEVEEESGIEAGTGKEPEKTEGEAGIRKEPEKTTEAEIRREPEKTEKETGVEEGTGHSEQEFGIERKPKKEEGAFGTGFLAGILLTVVCLVVFELGQMAARSGIFRKKESVREETGADILTDNETLRKLDEVQSVIEQNYLNEIDSDLLSAYLFKGIAAGLDDYYAAYYTEEELQSVLDSSRGEYHGIGATLRADAQTGEIVAVTVYENSPAEEGGLREDDVLLAVDGEPLGGVDLTSVVALIKSKDEFVLTVYRESEDAELELSITCGDVEVEHVTYRMLEDGIGYICITEFTESAVGQFEDAVDALNDQDMEKLIVDLRDTPGGLLSSVCDILDEILPECLLVYTEDRDGNREEYSSDSSYSVDCEIAVLVNEWTASASEIFAGAIQDYGLGPVIGTQTYGKGIVQRTFPLSDGSAIKMTVQKYFTPNGQDINGNGITPDIIVETGPEETESGKNGEKTAETESETIGDGPDEPESEADGEKSAETEAGAEEPDPVLERAIEELKKP